MRKLSVAFLASVAFCSILGGASASAGDFELSGWEGNSFESPQYYGIRGTYWFDGGSLADWGISLDYTHAKVYADDETHSKSGWSHFEFTDGLNLLTVNALYKFPIEDSKFTPYLGSGAGINVPHVEVTRGASRTFEYQFGGGALQAQAGMRYAVTDSWSVFAEYKGNYSFIDVDIDNGATRKTDILTHEFRRVLQGLNLMPSKAGV